MAVARSTQHTKYISPVLLRSAPLAGRGNGGERELTVVSSPHAEQDLSNIHACNSPVRLAPCTSHTRLQSISPSTRQHFVDTDDVVGVGADAEVETFFAGDFDEVSSSQEKPLANDL